MSAIRSGLGPSGHGPIQFRLLWWDGSSLSLFEVGVRPDPVYSSGTTTDDSFSCQLVLAEEICLSCPVRL